MLKKSDFYYELPEHLIAQTPVTQRDHSALMVINRQTGEIQDKKFYELTDFLREGDLLVLNDSRVIPARLYGLIEGRKTPCEFLLLEQKDTAYWEIICKPGRKLREGAAAIFGNGLLRGTVENVLDNGNRIVKFEYNGLFFDILNTIGEMPLPHYITHELADKERYQTIYAREEGSAAAPTAGLHFTEELLSKLQDKGISHSFVTLHVGLGTFRPVKASHVKDHVMHAEHYSLSEETARQIRNTKQAGGRVIAVGTTACRTLESVFRKHGEIRTDEGYTDIFIYPPYTFGCIDGLITNFHLPESTLIMLVSAFMGHERTMDAYRYAVEKEYRFFSFGDAMLIL